jgi:hypothetical protein
MLRAVGVGGALMLAVGRDPQLVHVVVLAALEAVMMLLGRWEVSGGRKGSLPVEENATEGLVKVLTESSNGLLQDIQGGAALLAVRALEGEVVVENLIDGVGMWERDELLVLGDILPVVDEHCLKMVGHRQLDGGTVVKVVLLRIMLAP